MHSLTDPLSMPREVPSCHALASTQPLGRSRTKGRDWKAKEKLPLQFYGAGSSSLGYLGDQSVL